MQFSHHQLLQGLLINIAHPSFFFLLFCWKSIDHKRVNLFLGILSNFKGRYAYDVGYFLNHHYFNNSYVITYNISHIVWFPSFTLLAQDFIGSSIHYVVPELRSVVFQSVKSVIGVSIDNALHFQDTLGSIDILSILFFQPMIKNKIYLLCPAQ